MHTKGDLDGDLEFRYIKCPYCNGSGFQYEKPCSYCKRGVKDLYRAEMQSRYLLILVLMISTMVYIWAVLSLNNSENLWYMALLSLVAAISALPFMLSLLFFICSLLNILTILKLRKRGSSEEVDVLRANKLMGAQHHAK